jgi:hypothetical protein
VQEKDTRQKPPDRVSTGCLNFSGRQESDQLFRSSKSHCCHRCDVSGLFKLPEKQAFLKTVKKFFDGDFEGFRHAAPLRTSSRKSIHKN